MSYRATYWALAVASASMIGAMCAGQFVASVVLVALAALTGWVLREERLNQQAVRLDQDARGEIDDLRETVAKQGQHLATLDTREAEFGRRLTTVENRTRPVGRG